jgi:uncharacterized protein (DUF849 family)
MQPAIIAVAPTGARRTKLDHPALPVIAAEIAREAAACANEGAQVLHLHVRDAAGAHTLDADSYRGAIEAVRDATGDRLVIQVTTEAVERYSRQEQKAVVRALRPEAISVALRELIPDARAEEDAATFLAWAERAGIAVQYITYSAEEAIRLVHLAARGVVPSCPSRKGPHALFVLGRYTTGQLADPAELPPFLEQWPTEWPWTVCAFGPAEAACLTSALALGGHVRVGFENNLVRPDGSLAASNAEQVAHVQGLVTAAGRPLATMAEARDIYGTRISC